LEPEAAFRALVEEGVEFVLIGGLAATVHGASRVTLDIDICFRQELGNCVRLARALGRLAAEIFPPRQPPVEITAELLHRYKMLHLRTAAGRLDLLSAVPGLGRFEDLAGGATSIEVLGLTVPVLSLEQLIRSKTALDQPKDREHLDQLLAIQRLRGEGG
jgi:predicted nucleotidyltransferase